MATNRSNAEDVNLLTINNDGIPIRKLRVSNLPRKITRKGLKEIFSVYGKFQCSYIRYMKGCGLSTFMTFNDEINALKVRVAADKEKIIIKGRVVKISPVSSDKQPDNIAYQKRLITKEKGRKTRTLDTYNQSEPTLNVLDDDCLIKIFSYLSIRDRIRIERVCKRWKIINPESWNNIKHLELSDFCLNSVNKIFNRCGRFLTSLEIIGLEWVDRHKLIWSATQHCHNLTNLVVKLDGNSISISQLLYSKKKYDRLTLSHLLILTNLPMNSMKRITLHAPMYPRYSTEYKLGLDSTQNMPRLQKLELEYFRLKPYILKRILDNNAITDLRFSMCSFENCISHILNLHELEHLDLECVPEVDDNFLIKLATNCPALQYLNISNCKKVTNNGVRAISQLTSLQIIKTDDFDDDSEFDYYDEY